MLEIVVVTSRVLLQLPITVSVLFVIDVLTVVRVISARAVERDLVLLG